MREIEFSSGKFPPYLPEDCQVNPGAYGFELAAWLSRTLAAKGVVTSYPVSEDWGWLIEYFPETGEELMIGCSSEAAEGEGFSGQPLHWRIFLRTRKKPDKRLIKAGAPDASGLIMDAILSVLAAEGIDAKPAEG